VRRREGGRGRGDGRVGRGLLHAHTAEWLKEGTPRARVVVRGLPARLLAFLGAIVSVFMYVGVGSG
jgi:hypothetical protein